jgi:hypothetical protein
MNTDEKYWRTTALCISAIWLYQGTWKKVILLDSQHLAIVSDATPDFLDARIMLIAIGLFETSLGISFLFSRTKKISGCLQILLLIMMNSAGIYFSSKNIADPVAMLLSNAVLVMSIIGCYRHEY